MWCQLWWWILIDFICCSVCLVPCLSVCLSLLADSLIHLVLCLSGAWPSSQSSLTLRFIHWLTGPTCHHSSAPFFFSDYSKSRWEMLWICRWCLLCRFPWRCLCDSCGNRCRIPRSRWVSEAIQSFPLSLSRSVSLCLFVIVRRLLVRVDFLFSFVLCVISDEDFVDTSSFSAKHSLEAQTLTLSVLKLSFSSYLLISLKFHSLGDATNAWRIEIIIFIICS